jgi:hypothetical protein
MDKLKSSNIGWPSSASKNVRGLDVKMQDAPFVSMRQAIREPSADPKNGFDVAESLHQVAYGRGDRRSAFQDLGSIPRQRFDFDCWPECCAG